MKSKSKHSIFFKSIVLAVAFALTVLCFPLNGLLAFADMAVTPNQLNDGEDYHVLTISGEENTLKNGVIAGGEYDIPHAYIGGNETWEIGKKSNNEQQLTDSVQLVSSNVKVTYYSDDDKNIVTSSDDTGAEEGSRPAYNGKFKAEHVGAYKITYSYTYKENGGEEITNKYEMDVISTLSKASVNFNYKNISLVSSSDHASVIDYSVKGAKNEDGTLKNVNILLPEVLNEDGEVEEDITFVGNDCPVANSDAKEKIVVISAFGGNGARDIDVSGSEEDGFYIDGEKFKEANYGDGEYNIKFDYYVLANNKTNYQFVASNTKTFSVYGTSNSESGNHNYYKKYDLEASLESDWQDNGETGIEKSIPKPIGLTESDSDPANEQVDVSFSVKVQFKASNSESTWVDIKDIKKADTTEALYSIATGNKEDDEKNQPVLNTDGTLYNPTKFKPLQDGFYKFIYTVRDFYGNEKTYVTTETQYRGTDNKGVTDKTKPTPMVYDASVETEKYEDIKDERFKSPTYASANGVVVYAIGMTDNHSNHDDEGVEMYRRIVNDEDVLQFTIDDYDDFNLVFNYRAKETVKAYENLITNNFNIRKETRKLDGTEQEIDSDADMLAWLAKNNYKIVVDNANYETIFGIFNGETFFEGKKLGEADITKDNFRDWAKSDAGKAAGFAYLDVDKTFGYDGENGTGRDTYKIQYVVKDAAKNEASKEVQMTIVTNQDDREAPEITFKTSLKTNYLPTDKVTFEAPTSTDYYDNYMNERVMYRYLTQDGKPVALYEEDGETARKTEDLTELWGDIKETYVDGNLLTEKYSDFHFTEGENAKKDGYFEITDPNASTYEIDLSEVARLAVKENGVAPVAVKLQIVTFVYDDAGNATMYAQSADISNTVDQYAPKMLEPAEVEKTTYYQGEEITLNDIEFVDDAIGFMSYDIKVTASNKTTTVQIPVTGSSQETKGKAFWTLHPGSFNATFAGTYQVAITVSDGADNSIIYFQTFKVKQRFAVQPPTIDQTTLPEFQTVELEGDENYNPKNGIEIPTPKVSYEIPNSVTWDVYSKNQEKYDTEEEYADYEYAVVGVKENGTADQYSVTQGDGGTFVPKAVDTYEIKYKVNVRIFDFRHFEYTEGGEFDGTEIPEGESLKLKDGSGLAQNATVEFLGNNELSVKDSAGTYYYVIVDNSGIKIMDDTDSHTPLSTYSGTMFENEDVLELFKTIRNYVLESNTYTIDVVDTKAPELREMPYAKSISKEKIEAQDNKMTIYGIQVNHKAGIDDVDVSKSSIKITYNLVNKLPSGGDVTYEGAEAFRDHEYEFPTVSDGTYTITYTVVDKRGNGLDAPITYTIAVGDTTPPTIICPDKFVESTYEIGKTTQIQLDLTELDYIDSGVGAPEGGWKPIVTLSNSTGKVEATEESEGLVYIFPLDEVGRYTLTIEVEDAVGNKGTKTLNFEVISKTADTTMTYQIVGTILIVVSVLILAGVIVYFIVSKVKLDKELKK